MQDLILRDNYTLELYDTNGEQSFIEMSEASLIDATFIASWLHGKSQKTQRAYAADIQKVYKHVNKSLREFTLDDFQSFINSLIDLKPSSRARTIAAVKSALSFALKTGYVDVNVGAVVKLPKLEDKLAERILSEQAVAKMFAMETNPRNHAILVLLYRAGLRVAELCELTWSNLHERDEKGQVTVFGKGQKTRHVLMEQSTWEEVMSLQPEGAGPDAYVFLSRQSFSRTNKKDKDNDALNKEHACPRLDESRIRQIVLKAAQRAGVVGKVTPHWMRHAHATHALERGAPITLVKDTLGHKSIETTIKYTHVRPNASSSQFLGV